MFKCIALNFERCILGGQYEYKYDCDLLCFILMEMTLVHFYLSKRVVLNALAIIGPD